MYRSFFQKSVHSHMKIFTWCSALLLAACFGAGRAEAAGEVAPVLMNYQGCLMKADRTPMAGVQNITFRIFDTPTGGTLIWSRQFPVSIGDDGVFNLILSDGGSSTEASAEESLAEAFGGEIRYFELSVEGYGTVTPRQVITSIPYALQSQYAHQAYDDFAVPANMVVAKEIRVTGNVTIADKLISEREPIVKGNVTVGARMEVPSGRFRANAFEGVGTCPIGAIVMWSGDKIPSGWVICDGKNGTPDLRNRFIAGAGGEYAVGHREGESKVRLTTSQIPPHSHTYNVAASQSGGYAGSEGGDDSLWQKTKDIQTGSAGSGLEHENRPPYYALYYIVRTR